MKLKILFCALATVLVTVLGIKDVKAVDYETALQLQKAATENYYNMQAQQAAAMQAQQEAVLTQQQAALASQQAIADSIAAQQKATMEGIQAQQKAAMEAIQAQQKAAMEAASAEQQAAMKAQQSAMEAASAIQAASLTTPQVDVVCDTNCSEKNGVLYATVMPDFVLVDISEQHAIFYRNGVRILGDSCVTGDAKRGYDTTVGIHKIIFKDLNRTLHGSYGEAFVKYWMRFTNSGQGLHDAGWRRNFGSSIYISNGSHGCVNLPRETAATIYNNSYVGMPVIVEN